MGKHMMSLGAHSSMLSWSLLLVLAKWQPVEFLSLCCLMPFNTGKRHISLQNSHDDNHYHVLSYLSSTCLVHVNFVPDQSVAGRV